MRARGSAGVHSTIVFWSVLSPQGALDGLTTSLSVIRIGMLGTWGVPVETSEVGGTHPALLEAMALGRCGAPNLRAALEPLLKDLAIAQDFGGQARERLRARDPRESVAHANRRLFGERLREAS